MGESTLSFQKRRSDSALALSVKSAARSGVGAAHLCLELDSDDSDEDDYIDTERLSPTFSSNQSARASDDSQQMSDFDDESMDVDSTEDDQSLTDDKNAEDGFDDSLIDSADNWSQDVVVDFDPSTCVAEQAMIGALMKKCRSFVKLLNKSSIRSRRSSTSDGHCNWTAEADGIQLTVFFRRCSFTEGSSIESTVRSMKLD